MIKGILLDLSGTLHIGNQALPGAREAVTQLQQGTALEYAAETEAIVLGKPSEASFARRLPAVRRLGR